VITHPTAHAQSLIRDLGHQLTEMFYAQSDPMVDLFHPHELKRLRQGEASLKVAVKVADALGYDVVVSLRRREAAPRAGIARPSQGRSRTGDRA